MSHWKAWNPSNSIHACSQRTHLLKIQGKIYKTVVFLHRILLQNSNTDCDQPCPIRIQ